jgi:serine/threonine protein kinase
MVAGRYRLDDRIDGGAMGDVWRGHDTRLDRAVAVKLLHSNLSSNPRFRTRFEHEARSVAALQAPGVVSLYDYGEEETSDGTVSYLIMELVRGKSLANLLRERGGLEPHETMRILAAAADALHAAHQAGIVHRDVKPANMLIDDNGNVKLVDFGIARARGEAGLTETGMVMGTVAYSSPEQLYDHELTGSADVYSLGIVGYECLSGRTPFGSSNPGAVINGHLHQQPPPLPPRLPQPVIDVVMRALVKEPNRRWRSAAEFARACREVASGGTTTLLASPPPSEAETRRMTSVAPMGAARPTSGMPRQTSAMPGQTSGMPRQSGERPRGMQPDYPARNKEPESSGRGPVVALVAIVIAVLIVGGLLLFRPWEGGTNPSGNTAADQTPQQGQDEQSGGDNADDEQQGATNPDDPTGEQAPDPESGDDNDDGNGNGNGNDDGNGNGNGHGGNDKLFPVPDVTTMPYPQALAELSDAGFQNIEPVYAEEDGSSTCDVLTQNPPAGSEVKKKDKIELELAATEKVCNPH